MNLKLLLASMLVLAAAAMFVPTAHADTLQTNATQVSTTSRMAVPQRGMSMTQVAHRFGAPVEKLPPAGGDSPRHPVINRWRYNGYTVYFERNRVICSVQNGETAAPKA